MSRYKGPERGTLQEKRWGRIDTWSARRPSMRAGVSARRPRVPVVSSIDDTRLEVWEERDRLHIALERSKDGKTLIEWWDDDARQAIEDGFLVPRRLHESAYAYGLEMGVFKERMKR